MSDLIPFVTRQIGADTIPTVNARDLYDYLNLTSDYSLWIKRAIKRANLMEDLDYVVSSQVLENPKGGRPASHHHLTFDAAKHVAMMSSATKGHEVRTYFIQKEKDLEALTRGTAIPQVKNPSNQMLIESIIRIDALEQAQLAQQAELIATQQKVIEGFLLAQQAHTKAEEAEASAQRAHDARDFFTVAEYMQYEYSEQQIPKREYKAISDHLQAYCLNKGKAFRRIPVGGKPWSEELAYHRSIYDAALPGWLHRRYAQENLTVLYHDNPDHEGA